MGHEDGNCLTQREERQGGGAGHTTRSQARTDARGVPHQQAAGRSCGAR
jgi:hypothetical protein